MTPADPAARPAIPMSQEEHASIQEVKTEVRGLAETLGKFIEASDKRFTGIEQRQEKIAESRQLSLQNIAIFIGMALGLAGAVSTLNTMTIKTTIATDVSPTLANIAVQNTVALKDSAGLHEEVKRIEDAIGRGKEERLAAEKDAAVKMARQEVYTAENYYRLNGHYPPER